MEGKQKKDEERKVIRIDLTPIMRFGWKRLVNIAVCAVCVILLIVCCAVGSSAASTRSAYNGVRKSIGQETYNSIYLFCQTFDQVNVPSIDVENYLIPQMKEYYTEAKIRSEILEESFGSSWRVLEPAMITNLDNAFSLYDTAFQNDQSTDEAKSAMTSCVSALRTLMDSRFSGGNLTAK